MSVPTHLFVLSFYQHSLQFHDGRFPVFAPLVLQEQFQDWRTGSNGRFMTNGTKEEGRLTVHELSSSCEQSHKKSDTVVKQKDFCPHNACPTESAHLLSADGLQDNAFLDSLHHFVDCICPVVECCWIK